MNSREGGRGEGYRPSQATPEVAQLLHATERSLPAGSHERFGSKAHCTCAIWLNMEPIRRKKLLGQGTHRATCSSRSLSCAPGDSVEDEYQVQRSLRGSRDVNQGVWRTLIRVIFPYPVENVETSIRGKQADVHPCVSRVRRSEATAARGERVKDHPQHFVPVRSTRARLTTCSPEVMCMYLIRVR